MLKRIRMIKQKLSVGGKFNPVYALYLNWKAGYYLPNWQVRQRSKP